MNSIFNNFIRGAGPRIIQDLVTSGAAILVSHGVITASQQEDFIGAVFFLVMLVFNNWISNQRKDDALAQGATAILSTLPAQTAVNSVVALNGSHKEVTAALAKKGIA